MYLGMKYDFIECFYLFKKLLDEIKYRVKEFNFKR